MNPASRIVNTFWTQANPKQPLLPQLSKHFVPALWGKGVLPIKNSSGKVSLKGRISLWLNSYRTPKEMENHIKDYFSKTAEMLAQTEKGRLVKGVLPLYREAKKAGFIKPQPFRNTAPKANIAPLRQAAEAAVQQREEVKPRVIANFARESQQSVVNAKALEEMVSREEAEVGHLVTFLQEHPEYISERDLEDKQNLMNLGLDWKKWVYEACFPDGVALESQARQKKLIEFAKKMAATCETGQFVFGGSYGRQASGMEAARIALKQIDPKNIPKELHEFLDNGTIPTAEVLVDKLFEKFGKEVKEGMNEALGDPKPTTVHALFPDNTRTLPPALQRTLPPLIARWVERWMQRGLIDDVRAFIPKGSVDFLLSLVTQHAPVIENPETRKVFFQETENWLKDLSRPYAKKGMDLVDEHLHELLQKISRYIPDGVLDAADLDSLALGGQFWLQFERQEDGNFTVLVYSSGMALNNHAPRPGANGTDRQWPMRLTGVAPQKLNEAFFLRLLQHQIEPQCDPHFPSHAADLFSILENHLQGTKEVESAWRDLDPYRNDWLEFTEAWLTNSNVPQGLPSFLMHHNALIRFCKGLIQPGQATLILKNQETANTLHSAVKQISKELADLSARKVLSPDAQKETEMVLNEAKEALARYHVDNGEGKQILETIRDWLLAKSDTAMEHLQSTRRLLSWMFGPEVGELLDAVVEITPAKKMEPVNQGWMATLWQKLTVTTLFKALVFGLWIHHAIKKPFSALTIAPAVYMGVKHGPRPISDWYGVVIRTVFRKLVESGIQLGLHLLTKHAPKTQKGIDTLKSLAQHVQGTAKLIAEEIRGQRELAFDLLPALASTSDSPLTIDSFVDHEIKFALQKKPPINGRYHLKELLKQPQVTSSPTTPYELESLFVQWQSEDRHHQAFSVPAICGNTISIPGSVHNDRISVLPIPQNSGDDPFWDHLTNPLKAMEAISKLASNYTNHTDGEPLAYFTLLAIQDKLARKLLKEKLNNYTTNASNLFRYIKSSTTGASRRDTERLKALRAYFWPEFTNRFPSEDEIQDRYTNALFSINGLAESEFIEELFTDPSIRQVLSNQFGYQRQTLNKNPELWGWVLYADASAVARPNSSLPQLIVPVPYKYLRELSHTAHVSVKNDYFSYGYYRDDTYSLLHAAQNWQKESLKYRLVKAGQDYLLPVEDLETMPSKLPDYWFNKLRWVLGQEKHLRDASAIGLTERLKLTPETSRLLSRRPTQSTLLADKSFDNFELAHALAWTEPLNQLNAVLNLMDKNPDKVDLADCRFALFRTGALLLQAQASNASNSLSRTITSSLKRVLDYQVGENEDRGALSQKLTSALNWLYFAIEVRNALEQYAGPNSLNIDLLDYLERMEGCTHSMHHPFIMSLKALAYPEKPTSPQEKREALLTLGHALFLNAREKRVDWTPRNVAFKDRLWRLMPDLCLSLDDSAFRTELFARILSSTHGNRPGLHNANWTQKTTFFYSWKNVQVDLWEGMLYDLDLDLLKGCRPLLEDIIPYDLLKTLDVVTPGVIETADGSFHVEYQLGKYEYTLKVWRVIDGTLFRCVEAQCVQGALKPDQIDKPLWLEENQNQDASDLRLHTDAEETFIIRKEDLKNPYSSFAVHSQQLEDGKVLNFVHPEKFRASLGAILGFSPLILGLTDSDSQQLKRFQLDLGSKKLTFDVKEINGELRAVREKSDPEEWIAPIQADPAVEGLGACLILENKWSRRVITFGYQFNAAAIERVSSYVNVEPGPRRWWEIISGQVVASVTNKVKHEFTIQEDGHLTSASTESMVYLLLQYLAQGNREKANRVAADLEMRCRMDAIPADAAKALLPLALVPGNFEGIATIRQRLFALLEENYYVHESTAPDFEPSTKITTIMLVVTALDLLQMDPDKAVRPTISKDQELFLFLRLFRLAGELFHSPAVSDLGLPKSIGSYSLAIGEAAFLISGFSPRLLARFKELRKEFGGDQSPAIKRLLRGVEVGMKFWKAPGASGPGLLDDALSTEGDGRRILRYVLDSLIKDTRSLDFKNMALKMKPVVDLPPLQIANLNADIFIENFASYFAIAKGDMPGQRENLAELLTLLQGGWNPSTAALVRYLHVVNSHPTLEKYVLKYIVPSTETLIKALNRPENQREGQLEEFFTDLRNSTFTIEVGSMVGSLIVKATTKTAVNMVQGATVKAYNLISGNGEAEPAHSEIEIVELPPEPPVAERISLNDINEVQLPEIDDYYDNLLNTLYEIAFVTTTRAAQHPHVQLEPCPTNPHVTEHINNSLANFYEEMPARHLSILKNKQALWDLSLSLSRAVAGLEKGLMQERKALMDAVNRFPRQGFPFTFEELCGFLIDGDFSPIAQVCNMRIEDLEALKTLEIALLRHVFAFGRLKQLQRVAGHMQKCLDTESEDQFVEEIELGLDQLLARRQYKPDDLPIQQLRLWAVYEMITNKLMWKCQIDVLQEDLNNGLKELLMSFGKTSCIIPLKARQEADGQHVVVVGWPKGQERPNTEQVSKLNARLGQGSQVLHMSRSASLSNERLLALNIVLQRVMTEGEILHLSQRDGQAWDLRFLLTLYNLSNGRYKDDLVADFESVAEGLRQFLRTLREKGILNGDEPHEQFHPRKNELNYPVGPPSTIAPQLVEIIDLCSKEVISLPSLRDLILTNEMDLMTPEIYQDSVLPTLAKIIANMGRWDLNDDDRKMFVLFLTDQPIPVESLRRLSTNTDEYRLMCMVKGMLTKNIPTGVCDKGVDKDFGLFEEGDDRHAHPFEGASEPDYDSDIRNPFEGLFKTYVSYYCNGLKLNDADKLVWSLLFQAKREANLGGNSNSAQIKLDKFLPKVTLKQWKEKTPEERNLILTSLLHDEEAISIFIVDRVAQNIRYWEGNLSSNAHNWDSMFNKKKRFHTTGTPYNLGCCPTDIEHLLDPKTLGQSVDIAAKKIDRIEYLTTTRPKEILDEVLTNYFTDPEQNHTSIEDGAGYFKGLKPIEVAKRMAEFCRQNNRTDIKVIVFYQKDTNANSKREYVQMALHVESERVELLAHCSSPPHERLTYYDEIHCFGADIPQKGNGRSVILVNRFTPIYAFMQYLFRHRGIKKFTKILDALSKINFDRTQKSTIVMKAFDYEALFGSIQNKADLFVFLKNALLQQLTSVLDDNCVSYRQQLHNVVRSALYDKILHARSVKEMVQLFKAFQNVFITTEKYDPIKMYGLQAVNLPADDVIKAQQKEIYDLIKDGPCLTDAEKNKLLKDMQELPVPPLTPTLRVYTDGSKIHFDILDANQLVSIEQVNAQESEAESELMQESQNQLQAGKSREMKTEYPEQPWPEAIGTDIVLNNWNKQFVLPIEARATFEVKALSSWGNSLLKKGNSLFKKGSSILQGFGVDLNANQETIPPIYSLSAAAEDAKMADLKALAPHFDPRIWVTNNFLPLSHSHLQPTELGSDLQKPLEQALIYAIEENGVYHIQHIGCLSGPEGTIWRKKLFQSLPQDHHKVFLYDVGLRDQAAGSAINPDLLLNNPAFLLLECQLNFIHGNGHYQKEQFAVLETWLKKCGILKAERAFKHIYAQKHSSGDYKTTTIAAIFRKLKNQDRRETMME